MASAVNSCELMICVMAAMYWSSCHCDWLWSPVCQDHIYCDKKCPNGYLQEGHGCEICECLRRDCPRPKCVPHCSRDKVDEFGCPICDCRPQTDPSCPIPWCAGHCEGGLLRNEQGCQTCNCNPRHCPLVRCSEHCRAGSTDQNGCSMCGCKNEIGPICLPILCPEWCPHGLQRDKHGCPTCQCKAIVCAIPICLNFCPGGYVKDKNGCDTCRCKNQNPICLLPPEPGLCKAHMPSYFYNSTSQQCERFIYGGCGGNDNRFRNPKKCRQACKAENPICLLTPEPGLCKAYMPSYFYNSTSQECERFIYGGCGGNDNRFWNPKKCRQACKAD